jgi:hypothetical protein
MPDKRLESDIYRDDRMFVMRITSDFTKESGGTGIAALTADRDDNLSKSVVLITYRNTPSLPACRVDDFPSRADALGYIMRVEPTCPRVSLDGCSPQPTPSWQQHLDWLHGQGLTSAAEGDAPIPKWADAANNPRECILPASHKWTK